MNRKLDDVLDELESDAELYEMVFRFKGFEIGRRPFNRAAVTAAVEGENGDVIMPGYRTVPEERVSDHYGTVLCIVRERI